MSFILIKFGSLIFIYYHTILRPDSTVSSLCCIPCTPKESTLPQRFTTYIETNCGKVTRHVREMSSGRMANAMLILQFYFEVLLTRGKEEGKHRKES